MVKKNFWPEIEEYALDIELFKEFWLSISNTDLSGHLNAIEIEMLILLPKKKELRPPKYELPWDKMRFIAFYDDLEFTKKYLESIAIQKPVVIVQEAFPLLDERYKLIASMINERFVKKSCNL